MVSLGTHTLTTTISTGQPSVTGIDGTGLVQSVGLSPGGTQVLAVLDGLGFPGDVMATIDPTTQTIVSTVNLETGADTMGAAGQRRHPRLRLGHRPHRRRRRRPEPEPRRLRPGEPALRHGGRRHVPARRSGRRRRRPPGTTSCTTQRVPAAVASRRPSPCRRTSRPWVRSPGAAGRPCGNASGDCREVPDVSADADPSTGYVIYDTVNGLGWTAIGGTSGAAPLWAAVLAVAASADGNTAGYGALNPILYTLAQKVTGHLPQRRHVGEQRLQRRRRRTVRRDQRVRHGDGAGDPRDIGPGDGPHHDPPRRRRLRVAGRTGGARPSARPSTSRGPRASPSVSPSAPPASAAPRSARPPRSRPRSPSGATRC